MKMFTFHKITFTDLLKSKQNRLFSEAQQQNLYLGIPIELKGKKKHNYNFVCLVMILYHFLLLFAFYNTVVNFLIINF
jgi:hypothetical protein